MLTGAFDHHTKREEEEKKIQDYFFIYS